MDLGLRSCTGGQLLGLWSLQPLSLGCFTSQRNLADTIRRKGTALSLSVDNILVYSVDLSVKNKTALKKLLSHLRICIPISIFWPDVGPERLFFLKKYICNHHLHMEPSLNCLWVCLQKLACYPISDIIQRQIQRSRRWLAVDRHQKSGIQYLHLWFRKLRLREVKRLAPGHTAGIEQKYVLSVEILVSHQKLGFLMPGSIHAPIISQSWFSDLFPLKKGSQQELSQMEEDKSINFN